MANTNAKQSWQEDLKEKLESLTPEEYARAHDFLVGYLAAMRDESKSG